jgi:hypothetical protein
MQVSGAGDPAEVEARMRRMIAERDERNRRELVGALSETAVPEGI